MKFLIAIVLYRIERKLTPLLKTNLSVFANVFFSLNLFSSRVYFSWCSKRSVCPRGCCWLKVHFGFWCCCVLSVWSVEVCNLTRLEASLLSWGCQMEANGSWGVLCLVFKQGNFLKRTLKSIWFWCSEDGIKSPLLGAGLLPHTVTAVGFRRRCDRIYGAQLWKAIIRDSFLFTDVQTPSCVSHALYWIFHFWFFFF